MINTVDIVKDLIQNLTFEVKIKSIVDNMNGTYTLETCNSQYLHPLQDVVIDGIDYKVVKEGFESNKTITIQGALIPTVPSFTLPALKFFHGTIIATNNELQRVQFAWDKFPMAYLYEQFTDKFNASVDSVIDRDASIRLFFLLNTDEENWLTKDHYNYVITPMRNVLEGFINSLLENTNIGLLTDFTGINHAKFGVWTSNGVDKRLFNDKLSGVELSVTLPIKKDFKCKC